MGLAHVRPPPEANVCSALEAQQGIGCTTCSCQKNDYGKVSSVLPGSGMSSDPSHCLWIHFCKAGYPQITLGSGIHCCSRYPKHSKGWSHFLWPCLWPRRGMDQVCRLLGRLNFPRKIYYRKGGSFTLLQCFNSASLTLESISHTKL